MLAGALVVQAANLAYENGKESQTDSLPRRTMLRQCSRSRNRLIRRHVGQAESLRLCRCSGFGNCALRVASLERYGRPHGYNSGLVRFRTDPTRYVISKGEP